MSNSKFYTFQVDYAPGIFAAIPFIGMMYFFDSSNKIFTMSVSVLIYLIAILYNKPLVKLFFINKRFLIYFTAASVFSFCVPIGIFFINFELNNFIAKLSSPILCLLIAVIVAKYYNINKLKKLGWEEVKN